MTWACRRCGAVVYAPPIGPRGAVCCTVLLRCGDSNTEREFPSDKVYRRNDRGIVGVDSLSLKGLAFIVIHTSVGRAARSCTVPALVTPIWVRRPSVAASRTVPRFSRAADAPG
jgi:hypothetical protein